MKVKQNDAGRWCVLDDDGKEVADYETEAEAVAEMERRGKREMKEAETPTYTPPAPCEPAPADAVQVTETLDAPFTGVVLETVGGAPVLRGVTLLTAGWSRNGNLHERTVMERDGPTVFEGAPAYATNHDAKQKDLKSLVGQYRSVRMDGDALKADLHGFASDTLLTRAVEAAQMFGPDRVGLSVDTPARLKPARGPKGNGRVVEAYFRTQMTSVDLVINPSAGGRLVERHDGESPVKEKITQLTEAVLADMGTAAVKLLTDGLTEADIREANPALAEAILAKREGKVQEAKPAEEGKRLTEADVQKAAKDAVAAVDIDKTVQEAVANATRLAECRGTLSAKLAAAKLSPISVEVVNAKFADRVFEAEALDKEIARLRDEEAKLKPNRPGGIAAGDGVVQESHDLHRLRLEGFFRQGAVKDKAGNTVQPYQSFRWEILPQMAGVNAYDAQACREALGMMAWHGDLYRNVQEAVLSTTFDQAWADVLNRVLMDMVQTPDLTTWRKWCIPQSFNDLTVEKKFVRYGGYGTYSTVSEGAPYQAVTTPGDEQVAFKPSKYGGTEEITWEAVLRDDVRLISRIPMAMGRGWAWTVHELVYGELQSNSGNGPTMDYDSTALYNARTVTNIVDVALAESSLNTARNQMGKMVELSSGKRIMYRPRFLLFASPDLDLTAYNLLGQGTRVTSGSDATLPNFFGPGAPGGGIEPIPVVYPTATTQRCELVADPRDVETAYIGFLNGRYEPEVFVQDAETVGSRFTADKITYKLRGTAGFQVANHRAFQRVQNTA